MRLLKAPLWKITESTRVIRKPKKVAVWGRVAIAFPLLGGGAVGGVSISLQCVWWEEHCTWSHMDWALTAYDQGETASPLSLRFFIYNTEMLSLPSWAKIL